MIIKLINQLTIIRKYNSGVPLWVVAAQLVVLQVSACPYQHLILLVGLPLPRQGHRLRYQERLHLQQKKKNLIINLR